MWESVAPVVVLLWASITESSGALCSKSNGGSYYYSYCSGYCCGSSGSQYCRSYRSSCSSTYNLSYSYSYISYTLSSGAIVGAAIGSIVFIGVLIAIIVCVCVASKNSRPWFGGRGRVIQTGTGATVITTTAPSQQMYQPYPMGQIPHMNAAYPPNYYSNAGYMPSTAMAPSETAAYPPPPPYPATAHYPTAPMGNPPPYTGRMTTGTGK